MQAPNPQNIPGGQAHSIHCGVTGAPTRDHTCNHPHHSGFSENNLPPVLFRLEATRQYNAQGPVGDLVENGQVVRDVEGQAIRDFDFLPRYIEQKPPAWLLEYWARTDARLTYKDVKARMVGQTRDKPSDNLLNMRREREVRGPLGLSCWNTRRGNVTRVEVERVERWSTDQIEHNTTMTIEYGQGRPTRLKKGSLAPGAPVYYPLATFLDNGVVQQPSERVKAALSLYHELSTLAKQNGVASWQLLPEDDLPLAWHAITEPKKNTYAAQNQ